MENIEVGVLDTDAVEVGRGECPSVERGGVLTTSLAAHTYKVSVLVNTPVTDIPGCLGKSLLIEKDYRVEVRLSTVIMHPSFAGVIWILEVAGKGGG